MTWAANAERRNLEKYVRVIADAIAEGEKPPQPRPVTESQQQRDCKRLLEEYGAVMREITLAIGELQKTFPDMQFADISVTNLEYVFINEGKYCTVKIQKNVDDRLPVHVREFDMSFDSSVPYSSRHLKYQEKDGNFDIRNLAGQRIDTNGGHPAGHLVAYVAFHLKRAL